MANVQPYSRLTDFDIALFLNGKHTRLYEKLGAFEIERFAEQKVWKKKEVGIEKLSSEQ